MYKILLDKMWSKFRYLIELVTVLEGIFLLAKKIIWMQIKLFALLDLGDVCTTHCVVVKKCVLHWYIISNFGDGI